jgi:hypothetical protein
MAAKQCSPLKDGENVLTGEEEVMARRDSDGDGLGRRSGGRTPELRQVSGKRTCGKGRLHESQLYHQRRKREEERGSFISGELFQRRCEAEVAARGKECESESGRMSMSHRLNTGREERRRRGKAPTAVTCHSWPAAVSKLGGKKGGETEKE